MAKKLSKGKPRVPKAVLRLPDLDQAKSAVLNSLSSIDAQRGYRHAMLPKVRFGFIGVPNVSHVFSVSTSQEELFRTENKSRVRDSIYAGFTKTEATGGGAAIKRRRTPKTF